MPRSPELAAATLLVLMAAAPAVAQRDAASPADITTAAQSCVAAMGPAGVDRDRLQRDGWQEATVSAQGRRVATSLVVHGRRGSNALVLLDSGAAAGPQACFVIARVAAARARDEVRTTLTDLYGAPIRAVSAGVLWRAGTNIVQLDATGTDIQPAVRVAVAHVRGGTE